jgi:YD repeat-containing protein
VASANSSNLDILYAYDGLNRLTAYDRGDINAGHSAITTLAFAQDWDLDQLNNWSGFDEDTDGDTTNDLVQDRTHNDANEITAISATTGPNWVDPTYDGAGNMITGPTPATETTTQKYVYDAWNRLVKVTDGSDVTLVTFGYDARSYRITKGVYAVQKHRRGRNWGRVSADERWSW